MKDPGLTLSIVAPIAVVLLGLAFTAPTMAQQQQPASGKTAQAGQQPSPWAKFAGFPCLSYTAPCSKAATRKPEKKVLDGPLVGDPENGKRIAFARNIGNCLACHDMRGAEQPGSRGLDLKKFGASGRSDAETYAMVYDMRTVNPETLMPPFGTNGVLTDQDIRDLVAFLQSSK